VARANLSCAPAAIGYALMNRLNDSPIFDYIVVGAGSAGCVLASRLSESGTASVLLLEAGPDLRPENAPPEMKARNHFPLLSSNLFQWRNLRAKRTRLQDYGLYMRGRVLGGSSAINGQLAIRGTAEDYDRWAALGCSQWSWNDVLPSFTRLESDTDYGAEPYHGSDGPIPVSRTRVGGWGQVDLAMMEAALDLGYKWHPDHNAPGSTGVSPYAHNSRNDRRVSSADGYLNPIRNRENLRIIGNSLVDRVGFRGRRASGVRVSIEGERKLLRGKEVILSAGAIHSPAILMRSGIGRSTELGPLGIAVLAESPSVGRNLSEHPAIGLELSLREDAQASPDDRFTNSCVRYSSGSHDSGMNDMVLIPFNHVGPGQASASVAFLGVSAFRCFSRGRLRLVSADPTDDPLIDLDMLSDNRDLSRMREGARLLFELARSEPIRSIASGVTVGSARQDVEDFVSDEAIDAWMMLECLEAYHAVGTCRMGPRGDRRSVVDPDCRVIGVDGLRVIDASIMPENPRANTHLTTVMIAEHASAKLTSDG
jgi:5-(hydroxymethyl)furfural/furfural oxidase